MVFNSKTFHFSRLELIPAVEKDFALHAVFEPRQVGVAKLAPLCCQDNGVSPFCRLVHTGGKGDVGIVGNCSLCVFLSDGIKRTDFSSGFGEPFCDGQRG